MGLVKSTSLIRSESFDCAEIGIEMAKVTEAAELGHMYGLRCLDSDGRRSSTVVSLTGSICLVAKIVRFFNLSRKIKPFVTLFYSSF
ncbi:unnamed protein product [Brassica rapa subsp. narinosa]